MYVIDNTKGIQKPTKEAQPPQAVKEQTVATPLKAVSSSTPNHQVPSQLGQRSDETTVFSAKSKRKVQCAL
jgi:hypothetical protein